jgi:hypothetical protein
MAICGRWVEMLLPFLFPGLSMPRKFLSLSFTITLLFGVLGKWLDLTYENHFHCPEPSTSPHTLTLQNLPRGHTSSSQNLPHGYTPSLSRTFHISTHPDPPEPSTWPHSLTLQNFPHCHSPLVACSLRDFPRKPRPYSCVPLQCLENVRFSDGPVGARHSLIALRRPVGLRVAALPHEGDPRSTPILPVLGPSPLRQHLHRKSKNPTPQPLVKVAARRAHEPAFEEIPSSQLALVTSI